MKAINKAHSAEPKTNETKLSRALQSRSYLNIAGRLASEMVGFLRSEPSASSEPFQLVLIGNHGQVIFECEVDEGWKVRRWGTVSRMRRSHFPATALLTDCSQVTRTFLIERDPLLASIA